VAAPFLRPVTLPSLFLPYLNFFPVAVFRPFFSIQSSELRIPSCAPPPRKNLVRICTPILVSSPYYKHAVSPGYIPFSPCFSLPLISDVWNIRFPFSPIPFLFFYLLGASVLPFFFFVDARSPLSFFFLGVYRSSFILLELRRSCSSPFHPASCFQLALFFLLKLP